MAYAAGLFVGVLVAGLARWLNYDRDKSFYPTVLIVIAFYYVLFAVIGGDITTLLIELAIALVFTLAALWGGERSLRLVALGLIAHGIFDILHPDLIANSAVPSWWPAFCLVVDVVLGVWLLVMVQRRMI